MKKTIALCVSSLIMLSACGNAAASGVQAATPSEAASAVHYNNSLVT